MDGTGLQYYNARYYDPAIGQFISPDTLVPDVTNLFDYNRYMYVRGRPLNMNDPSGHASCNPILFQMICRIWNNLTKGTSWIAHAPETARVEAFKAGYEHDLPIEFIDQHAYGGGSSTNLSAPEMAQLGVIIDLSDSSVFDKSNIFTERGHLGRYWKPRAAE